MRVSLVEQAKRNESYMSVGVQRLSETSANKIWETRLRESEHRSEFVWVQKAEWWESVWSSRPKEMNPICVLVSWGWAKRMPINLRNLAKGTAVAVLIQIYGDSPPTVWYEIRITVSKIVATMVLFPIGRKFNRRRTASFANPNSSQASDAYVACSRTWILVNFNHVVNNQRHRPKEFKFKIREVTLNLRFTYRCLVGCATALQY